MNYINIEVWVGIKYDYHCACNHACVCIFLSPPLLSIQYTCCRLCKSPSFEPPEREAVRQEPCLFKVGCECDGYSVVGQKALSFSLLILECNLCP